MNQPPSQFRLSHPAWVLLFAGAPIAAGVFAGPLFIDDAYITFRFAENVAAGRGFIYNDTPILGTTAPLWCLLLAAGRILGASIPSLALVMGIVGGGLVPVLLWRWGVRAGKTTAGFFAALFLAFFPHWWLISLTGMETTLAGALVAAFFYLELRRRPELAGLCGAALALTRPDTALLPAVEFLRLLAEDRRAAFRFALAGALGLLPWIVYGFAVFGSPLPASLDAKRLIHHYPWHLTLLDYLSWFGSLTHPPAMLGMNGLWFLGAGHVLRSWRKGMTLVIWPPLFLLGLAATEVGPFFWYKFPVLPAYFLLAGLGLNAFAEWEKVRPAARKMIFLFPLLFLLLQFTYLRTMLAGGRQHLQTFITKEHILREMAEVIRQEIQAEKLAPPAVKIYVGETGVIGYELRDCMVIDSAGIVSPEVYELRKQDWESLRRQLPHSSWQNQWRGSPRWSREVIEKFQPEFIATDIAYLHLPQLVQTSEFQARYQLLKSWRDSAGHSYVVLKKKKP